MRLQMTWRRILTSPFLAGVVLLLLPGGVQADAPPSFWGQWGTFGEGQGEFRNPRNVAVDSDGHVYVSEWNGNRIQKFRGAGNWLTVLAVPGPGSAR